jgi:mRNA-degrading endonuclease YafQ of YafQ-DinJ toxin-antitoxin module
MSRIPVINEISVPRDSRVLAQFRQATRPATASRAQGVSYFFKQDPFDPRLRSHKIHRLSARYARTIYAAEIEAHLRVVFYIEGDIVVTVDLGSHDLYRG